jgi:hypothetical protein
MHLGKDDFYFEDVLIETYDAFENGNLRTLFTNFLNNVINDLNILLWHPVVDNGN